MRPKNILVVSSHILPHVGGVEVLVDREVSTLADAGNQVVVLASDIGGAGRHPDYAENVKVIRVPAWDILERRAGLTCPLFSPRLVSILWDVVGWADTVHVHQFTAINSALALVISWLRGKPCILTEHNGIQPRRSMLATFLFRLVAETAGRLSINCASKCVTYNARVEKTLRKLGGPAKPIEFIPYPVDTSLFVRRTLESRREARDRLRWPPDRKKVLFVGRFVAEKGIPLLLQSTAPEQYDIVFCGSGDVAILGGLPRAGVEYLPPRPQAELVSLYHAADVLALPSYVEGFPLAAREAMACGLPVVLGYDPGYEPYRAMPLLSFCGLTPASISAAIRSVLDGWRWDASQGDTPIVSNDPRHWVDRIYRLPGKANRPPT